MNLALNDLQTEVLTRELHIIIPNDRYPLSPRIVVILGQPRPVPNASPCRRWTRCREPPPLKVGKLAAISRLSPVDGCPEVDT